MVPNESIGGGDDMRMEPISVTHDRTTRIDASFLQNEFPSRDFVALVLRWL
ncbi:hypothetical protein FF011L_45320 [Roseimaritima multifibrata]|uniref:Uncharacterized protein n=1 Tax=Roseimaritima multifibrata TaxID=1930274 RepID=A0A517MLH5_9BACT|nr:hypothetical protein FF011L_45320 [Roseimaritima multifibrata]